MPHEVIDTVERHAERGGQPLGCADADHERAGQARARRDRDSVDVGKRHASLVARCQNRRLHRLEVGPRRDLGHDAAEARVLVHARCDGVGQQLRAAHDADAGLVTAGLDAEHERRGRCGFVHTGSFIITIASMPSGW